jgi:hypothetical protein
MPQDPLHLVQAVVQVIIRVDGDIVAVPVGVVIVIHDRASQKPPGR